MSCKYIYKGIEYDLESLITYISINEVDTINNLLKLNLENSSKVIDENGEPLVVYHGASKYGFTEFKPNQSIANLIFFSEERKGAEPFTYGGALGSGIYEVFLNVRNPLNPKNVYKSTEEQSVAKRAIKNNKDGFKVADFSMYSGFAETNWAIFNPNQIKSATENIGTYSANTNDIRYSLENIENINVVENDYIESELFKDISSIPFITKEQSLGVYKSIYTNDLNYWEDSDVKC